MEQSSVDKMVNRLAILTAVVFCTCIICGTLSSKSTTPSKPEVIEEEVIRDISQYYKTGCLDGVLYKTGTHKLTPALTLTPDNELRGIKC